MYEYVTVPIYIIAFNACLEQLHLLQVYENQIQIYVFFTQMSVAPPALVELLQQIPQIHTTTLLNSPDSSNRWSTVSPPDRGRRGHARPGSA